MFCPKCGKDDQTENSYCRQCGLFLPDFENPANKKTSVEQHLKINGTFSVLSGVISLTLAIFLHLLVIGKDSTPIIVYLVAGFLTANFFWQAQTYWRTLKLKRELVPKPVDAEINLKPATISDNQYSTDKLLPEPDFTNIVPPSVTENTTNILHYKIKK